MPTLTDPSAEGLALGFLCRDPTLFTTYGELISPQQDFSDATFRTLYELAYAAYLEHNAVNSTTLSLEILKRPAYEQESYRALGGYRCYERLMGVASKSEAKFSRIHTRLKTFATLRELAHNGYDVYRHLDRLVEHSPEEILGAYEKQLAALGARIRGFEDSVVIGERMSEFYEDKKAAPDFGIDLPFPLLNRRVRGWRTGKMYCSAYHSGVGKSREAAYLLTHVSILGQEPSLIIVNEQDEEEWRLMLLTCVANNILSPQFGGHKVDEDEIALGLLTGERDEIVRAAARYIEQHSKISFLEAPTYDFAALKLILKRHKLRGINYVVIDTLKPFRDGTTGMADWLQFVYTSEQLKRIIGSPKKGGLDMALWLTVQLTDDSLTSKVLNSSSLASGKQIKHNLDVLKMGRMLDQNDKRSYAVVIQQPGNPFNGETQTLDPSRDYMLVVLDKNRAGKDHESYIVEVDKGKVMFKELGWAKRLPKDQLPPA